MLQISVQSFLNYNKTITRILLLYFTRKLIILADLISYRHAYIVTFYSLQPTTLTQFDVIHQQSFSSIHNYKT